MNKRLLSIIGTITLIGIVLVLKFVVQPMIEVYQKKESRQGWTAARSELKGQIKTMTAQAFIGLDLPAANTTKMEDCIVDKSINYLNSTDCDYHYVSTTTSKSEHLKKQDACLKKIGWEKTLEGFTVECAKKNIPNNWNIADSILSAEIDKSLTGRIPDAEKRKKAVSCVVKATIGALEEGKCNIINKEAEKLETFFTSAAECFKRHPKIGEKSKAAAQACLGIKKPEEKPEDNKKK